MSEDTRIINAISGESISLNIRYFISFDDFKSFVVKKWNIPSQQLLILLPYGNKLKETIFENYLHNTYDLNNEENTGIKREFYVYDRRLFTLVNTPSHFKSSDASNVDIRLSNQTNPKIIEKTKIILDELTLNSRLARELSLIKPVVSPLSEVDLSNEKTLTYRKITSILTTNLGWLNALLIDVFYLETLVKNTTQEIADIIKCLYNVELYLKIYSFDVESLYNSNILFLNQLAEIKNNSNWSNCYSNVLDKLTDMNNQSLQHFVDKPKLDEEFNQFKELDSIVNSDLMGVKNEIDINYKYRNDILENIQITESSYRPDKEKYKLEDEMLVKFKELVENIKTESHDILERDSSEFTVDYITEITTNILENQQNKTVKTLTTISQALYSKVEEYIKLKNSLQITTIIIMGQIACSQMKILNLKKTLLKDCNQNLNLYQNSAVTFAHVEDIPIIYGLYLIESYRRHLWYFKNYNILQSFTNNINVITDKEKSERHKWSESFGSIASRFATDLDKEDDLNHLSSLFPSKDDDPIISNSEVGKYHKTQCNKIRVTINSYLQQLSNLQVGKDILNILSKKLLEVQDLEEVLQQDSDEEFTKDYNKRLSYYRTRIGKLESLLHEATLSNPNHWPSGLISMTHFQDNIQAVGVRLPIEGQLFPVLDSNDKEEMRQSRDRIVELEDVVEQQKKTILEQKIKITDVGLEVNAYRETLNHLKYELSRLTSEEQKTKEEKLESSLDFKRQLTELIEQNQKHLKNDDDLIEKRNLAENTVLKLTLDHKTIESGWEEEKHRFQGEIESLKHINNELETKVDEREIEAIPVYASIETQTDKPIYPFAETLEDVTSININENNRTSDGNNVENVDILGHRRFIQTKLFEIIRANIFILENIGLLLVSEGTKLENSDTSEIQIKRVKGLRKASGQLTLDESTQVASVINVSSVDEGNIKSLVYQNLKDIFDRLINSESFEDETQYLTYIDRLYSEHFYENSVIRRFKDIESLAKKLTKENKLKKGIIENYKTEKITLKNFQIGDLVLFLPTSDNGISSITSSISSLNSSFSSVDLSTPPPLQLQSQSLENGLSPLNQRNHPSQKKKNKITRPWAAFTAFDETVRYFFKNVDGAVSADKDWFIGNITNMQKFVVENMNNSNNNPYRLPKGSVWYQVTADLVSFQE